MSALRIRPHAWCSVLLLVAALGGCDANVVVMRQYDAVPVPTGAGRTLTQDEVGEAIRRGADDATWRTYPIGPGHLAASLQAQEHVAAVDITYTASTYSIHYQTSRALDYDGDGHIHKDYNLWVEALQAAIQAELQKARQGH